ncbi:peptide-methionine (S)-S-oxide reductase MsrA [Halomonas sp.]|uniref:peptide-methionine (S)-S-oxide reductase MsrA n=1 Tax=Halomonas sp. TaxID=1486246 RepID=UPI002580D82F|nr:peptide-methionine (S)-S-oxide reductase MsrA [Halomonas sp.]MCJ8287162.1 peptide-methionine (S)-S-oxide reductase MsrA [Halomonas sp.]NQY71877.1 peptide-methionine (S)-S-oxide reductase MsrA [Halomonas sp.]
MRYPFNQRTFLLAGLLTGAVLSTTPALAAEEKAIFAGGCYWCVEEAFDKIDGVEATISGFAAGNTENPTYEQVGAGGTGHAEAVEITYDSDKVSYEDLLYVFWRNIDPLVANRQFCDVGDSYRSALLPLNDEQRELAEASKADIAERFDQPIETTIEDPGTFYATKDEHQDYYQKNKVRYTFYKNACGRPDRLKEIWGDEAMPHEAPAQSAAS